MRFVFRLQTRCNSSLSEFYLLPLSEMHFSLKNPQRGSLSGGRPPSHASSLSNWKICKRKTMLYIRLYRSITHSCLYFLSGAASRITAKYIRSCNLYGQLFQKHAGWSARQCVDVLKKHGVSIRFLC